MTPSWRAIPIVLALAGLAHAAPVEPRITVQGVLETQGGAPADGTFTLTLKLFAQEADTTALHTQTVSGVVVTDGRFDVVLGPLAQGLLDGRATVWLETTVDGTTLPRSQVRATPFALVAEHANSAAVAASAAALSCTGCVNATALEPGAVSTTRLSDGAVTPAKVSFDYAGSSAQGGPALSLSCTGCVGGGHIAPNVALDGNVSVKGTFAACTALGSGCTVSLPGASLAAASGAPLDLRSPQGARVVDGGAFKPLEFGAGTAHGDLAVDPGNLSVSGNVAIGASSSSDRLHVEGVAGLAGSDARLQLSDGRGSFVAGAAAASVYRTTGGGAAPFDVAGNLVLQPQTTSGAAGSFVVATGAGTPVPRLVVGGDGRVGVGTQAPQAALSVAGGVQVGDDPTCNAQKAGTLRWTGTDLEVCDGAEFGALGSAGPEPTPTAEHFTLVSTGNNWVVPQPSGNWGSAPGLGGTIQLAEERFVHLRWIGTMRWAGGGNGLCHAGFTFVVDGARLGNGTWGLGIVVQEGSTRWHSPFDIEYGLVLGPGVHTITAQATNGTGYGNCYLDGDGGLIYDGSRVLISAYDPARVSWVQGNGTLGLGHNSGWDDVPGVGTTFTLTGPSHVQVSATGTQHQNGSQGHCAYRFVLDGQGLGNGSHGQAIVVGDADQGWWTPMSLKMGVNLGAGQHSVKLQMRNSSSHGNCYAHQDVQDYSRYRMFVRTAPQGSISASYESNSTGFTVPYSWVDIPNLSHSFSLSSLEHVHFEMAGTQRTTSNGSSHTGYRLVIDGQPLGHGTWGLAIDTQEGAETWWAPAVLGWGASLGPGLHTVKVQALDSTGISRIDSDNQGYDRYRLLVRGPD